MLLVLALSYMIWPFYDPQSNHDKAQVMYFIVCIFLPLNLLAFSFFEERGVFTLWGSTRFLFLMLQALTLLMIIEFQWIDLNVILNWRPIDHPAMKWADIPLIALIIFIIGLIISYTRLLLRPSAQTGAFFGVLLAALMISKGHGNGSITVLLSAAAGLMLIVATLQESYSMAYIDDLTGLSGRRALKERLNSLYGHYTIAMVDVDHFKRLNDNYGHDVGDQVLLMLATRLNKISGGGKAYRYGGEEFTILFPGKSASAAFEHLETLRREVAASPFKIRRTVHQRSLFLRLLKKKKNQLLTVTISIGLAEKNESLKNTWDVLKAADQALYHAKNHGRNCVSK